MLKVPVNQFTNISIPEVVHHRTPPPSYSQAGIRTPEPVSSIAPTRTQRCANRAVRGSLFTSSSNCTNYINKIIETSLTNWYTKQIGRIASSGRGTRVQTTGSQPHMNHNRCFIDIRSHFVQFLVFKNSKIWNPFIVFYLKDLEIRPVQKNFHDHSWLKSDEKKFICPF